MALLQKDWDFASGKKQKEQSSVDWQTRTRAFWVNNFCNETKDPRIECQRMTYIAEGNRAQKLADLMENIVKAEHEKADTKNKFSNEYIEKLANKIVNQNPILRKKKATKLIDYLLEQNPELHINSPQGNLKLGLIKFLEDRLISGIKRPYIESGGAYATSSRALEGTAKHRRLVTSLLTTSAKKPTSDELSVKMPTFINTVGLKLLNPFGWINALNTLVLGNLARLANRAINSVLGKNKADSTPARILKGIIIAPYYGISLLLNPAKAMAARTKEKKIATQVHPETSVIPTHRRTTGSTSSTASVSRHLSSVDLSTLLPKHKRQLALGQIETPHTQEKTTSTKNLPPIINKKSGIIFSQTSPIETITEEETGDELGKNNKKIRKFSSIMEATEDESNHEKTNNTEPPTLARTTSRKYST